MRARTYTFNFLSLKSPQRWGDAAVNCSTRNLVPHSMQNMAKKLIKSNLAFAIDDPLNPLVRRDCLTASGQGPRMSLL